MKFDKGLTKGITKVSLVVLVLAAFGFFVFNFVIPVFANTHSSHVVLNTTVVKGGLNYGFTVTVYNDEGAPISEFRIYNNTVALNGGLEPFTNLVCYPADNWHGPYYIKSSTGDFCQYTAETTNDYILAGQNKAFIFSADAPTTDCWRTWHFETRDPDDFYIPIYTKVAVDALKPITIKSFNGPQKKDGDVEWIDGVTLVELNATDPEPHPSNVSKLFWRNTLVDDKYCWSISACNEATGSGKFNLEINEDGDNELIITIPKDQESCHLLEYYAIDNVENEEQIKKNCFFVDKTPPVGTKEVGDPKVSITDNIEIVGKGKVEWSTEQVHSGAYAAELYVLDGTKDWAGIDVAVDIALEDINSLTFWELIKQYNPNGWDVNVILGVDTDGDGFEADTAAWHVTSPHDPSVLSDDTFIEMDGALGGNPSTGVWTNINAYNTPQWWTVNLAGDGFAGGNVDSNCYNTLSTVINSCAPDDVRFEPTDHVKVIKLEIGGSQSWNDEIAFVDELKLNGNVIIDEPTSWWVRDHVTPITLDCKDQPPHPSDNEEVCYRVSLDLSDYTKKYCSEDLELIEQVGHEGEWCCIPAPKVITFGEDSLHGLKWFCRDAVDKKSSVDIEQFKVDSQPPIITKTMYGEDHLGYRDEELNEDACPPKPDKNDKCYVKDNRENGVDISVKDNTTFGCAVDKITCTYIVWWEATEEECRLANGIEWSSGWCKLEKEPFNENARVIFREDSTHKLVVNCQDALGNRVEDEETFLVDSTPPVTKKTYGQPYYSDGYREWINSSTLITLTATDAKVGVDKTWYYDAVVPDSYCYEKCIPTEEVKYMLYTGPFNKAQESCHLLQYYSVDKLGNIEPIKWQCVFVDNKPPVGSKEIGEPNISIKDGEFNYWVTKDTEIKLNCNDQDPHPVDHNTVWWRFSTKDTGGNWVKGDWQHSDKLPVIVKFPEDSYHDLEYYCVDALGNADEHDTEYFIVETVPPVTTKTYEGPHYEKDGKEWIDTATKVVLTAVDSEPHPSGVSKTWYDVILADNKYCESKENCLSWGVASKWTLYETPFPIAEESCHVIEFYSEDNLGNRENVKWQCVFVDKTPPVTTKTYGDPKYADRTGEWITSNTLITLTVEDAGHHPSGIKETKYRVARVDDIYCNKSLDSYCKTEITAEWQTYTGSFKIDEQSCHKIEFYSVDNVDKKEQTKSQCVYVDNTPPVPVKTVGEPKARWDGKDANFYDIADKCWSQNPEKYIECWKVTLATPISLECEDPEPHPVNNEKVCFNVEVDAEDESIRYCNMVHGTFNEEDGYCCLDRTTSDFKFKEKTEHNLKYYCVDALGNKGPIDEEKFKVEGTKLDIELYKKWNLISVPFVLLNNNINEVFKDIKENISSVWKYDSENNIWHVWTPGDAPDSFTTIDPGWGYWVLAKDGTRENPVMLTIGGSLFSEGVTPPDRTLISGWNLIGYYGSRWQLYNFMPEPHQICGIPTGDIAKSVYGDNAYCSLNSLVNKNSGLPYWSTLEGYLSCNANKGYFYSITSCPVGWESDTIFARMYAGHGYWIYLPLSNGEKIKYGYSPATALSCIWPFDKLQCIYNRV